MNMNLQGRVTNDVIRPNAGIDVSKQTLDGCCGSQEARFANDAGGWDALAAMLRAAAADVVVEATGGYERSMVCALQQAGMCVARVNPRQARDFAKSMGYWRRPIGWTHAPFERSPTSLRGMRSAPSTSRRSGSASVRR